MKMLLYQNSFESAYEEIKTWNPVWYQEVSDMDALWRVYGKQLDDIQADIIRAVDNNFIDYADEQTISTWEKKLGITYSSLHLLQERRNVIKALIVGRGKIGQQEIREISAAFTDIPVRVGFSKGVITVIISPEAVVNIEDIRRVLESRIPAHLSLNISRYNTHRYLRRFTNKQLSNYTNYQLRNEPIIPRPFTTADGAEFRTADNIPFMTRR